MKKQPKPKKKKAKSISNNLYMLKLAWGFSRGRVVSEFIDCGLEYFGWVFFTVVFTRYLIQTIEDNKPFSQVLLFLGVTMAVMAAIALFRTWYSMRYKPITDRIIAENLNKKLLDKAAQVDLECYEDTEFYNTYTIAIKEADTRVSLVLNNIARVIFTTIAAISVFAFMFSIDRFVVLFTISPLIGNFAFGTIVNKIIYNRKMEGVPYERRMDYVNRVIYLQDFAKEIRLSNIYRVLKKTYDEGFNGVIKTIKKYSFKTVFFMSLRNIFTFVLVFEGVFFYGAYRAIVTKTVSLSEFTVLASAIVSSSWMLIGLSEGLVAIYQNGLYIAQLRKFMDYEAKIVDNPKGLTPEPDKFALEMDKVSFTYKGQKEPILKDISIRIRDKEKIALVGHNGAGKTTLIKLLMRLYDPDQGEIRLNNKDIKQYSLKKYREMFGTAFQDFQLFSMTVSENVLMHEPTDEKERELVEKALHMSGAYERVASLESGIDTMLTREFDDKGVVLSGGEAQKVAIARAFAKDFSIAIFDEPSSALDPIAEYKLYESMIEVCKDKPAIFISHRLSSVINTDRIYMLEDGRIIEEGTHESLMKMNGKYADMFRKQAEQYVISDKSSDSLTAKVVEQG